MNIMIIDDVKGIHEGFINTLKEEINANIINIKSFYTLYFLSELSNRSKPKRWFRENM